MEPGKPPSSYGLDPLAAVEFQNWVRTELCAELTTLDINECGVVDRGMREDCFGDPIGCLKR